LAKNKISDKKTKNKKIGIIMVSSILILILSYSFTFNSDLSTPASDLSFSTSDYIEKLSVSHTMHGDAGVKFFNTYFTPKDAYRLQQNLSAIDGVRLTLNENSDELIDILKSNEKTIVIYPIFTSAAYKEPGFYTHFRGDCDESCITDLNFENPEFKYTSSGLTAQILHLFDYDFITDIDVDKNPTILQNYDTVILLHNEYVTQKEFDAITSHPNLIFLFPNALYAKIDVNYDDNTMTLIRGHNYPEESVSNGFNYEIEEEFHNFEYDNDCLEWSFIEIDNGYHLNCYPDDALLNNLEILIKLKELLISN